MSPMEQLAKQEYERGYSDGKSDFFAAGVAEGEMRARQRMIANRVAANQHPFAASGKPIDHIAASGKVIAEPVKQEPVAWCDHVEHRLLTWRQSFVNRSGDQLALDDFMDQRSLEDLIDFVCDEYTAPTPRKPEPVEQEPVATDLMDMLRLIETIKYLRGIAERGLGREIREDETIEQFVLGYVKQLESTQTVKQEPVAWHHPECKGECIACLIERCVKDSYGTQGLDFMLRHINAAPVSAETKAEQEKQGPVAFVKENPFCPEGRSDELTIYLPVGTALYAAPVSAKREWVDLTEGEQEAIYLKCNTPSEYTNAVIAAFKEKNN